LLPRTRHSQNHLNLDAPISSFEETGSRAAALDGARGTSFAAPRPRTTAQATPTTHHMRRSTPARGPSSAVYATQQNARAGLPALSLRLTCRLVDCLDLIQRRMKQSMSALARRNTNLHTSGSSHRLSIITHRRTEVQGRGECTHVFSGSICTTRSFFPLCHPEKCHCNEV